MTVDPKKTCHLQCKRPKPDRFKGAGGRESLLELSVPFGQRFPMTFFNTHAFALACLSLCACAPVAADDAVIMVPQLPVVTLTDAVIEPQPSITIALQGNDGAAVGQQGTVTLSEAGLLRCVLIGHDVITAEPTTRLVYEAQIDDLFAPLAAYIRETGVAGVAPAGPNVASVITGDGAFHIPPDSYSESESTVFFGVISPVGFELSQFLFEAAEGRCLPFG